MNVLIKSATIVDPKSDFHNQTLDILIEKGVIKLIAKRISNSNPSILSYEDGSSFLTQSGNAFCFSSALNDLNSNFKNSPLIVPVFYNIAKQSLKLAQLYFTVGRMNSIDINTKLSKDEILTLGFEDQQIIPLQHGHANKVELFTDEYPSTAGIFEVKNKDNLLTKLSYNYTRSESNLNYFDLSSIENVSVSNEVSSTLHDIKSASNVNELWKWFVIFALAFLIIEMLILKFFK